jgi:hypothetical protein
MAKILSDKLRRWVLEKAEVFAGVYDEGERPPERLGQQVIVFANLYPHATRQAWATFAISLVNDAYKTGYIRGVEWVERDPVERTMPWTPEEFADRLGAEWRENPAPELLYPQKKVEDVGADSNEIADAANKLVAALAGRIWRR